MSKINQDIDTIRNKLQEVDAMNTIVRINKIDESLKVGELDLTDLSSNEVTYVHSKLHFFYHMKNPPLEKEKIEQYHAEIKEKLQNHAVFDHLDNK